MIDIFCKNQQDCSINNQSDVVDSYTPNTVYCHYLLGFSLFELLLVLAMVAMVASFGFGSWLNLIKEERANNFINLLSRQITMARYYALNQGIAVTICPLSNGSCTNSWNTRLSVFSDESLDRQFNENDRLIAHIAAPSFQDKFTYPRKGITFRTDGSINGFQSGTFRYCISDSNSSYGLIINQTGRMRSQRGEADC